MLSRKEALERINEHVLDENLKKHMIAVSAIMKGLGKKLNQNEKEWELLGLLHDIDYDETKDNMEKHGSVSAKMLEGILPEDALHSVKAHAHMFTGIEPETIMDWGLIAADAISGLVIAAALMMPNKKLAEVRVKTVKKKFKDKSFARSVNRDNIKMCEKLGLSLEEFYELSIESLKEVSDELGL